MKKRITAALCVLALITAFIMCAFGADHDCSGEMCDICMLINFQRAIAALAFIGFAGTAVKIILALSRADENRSETRVFSLTPIMTRVRMND